MYTGEGAVVKPSAVDDVVEGLLSSMTLEEKLAQLTGLWMGASGEDGQMVAPMMDEQLGSTPPFEEFAVNGLGHFTRVFGTHPVEPTIAAMALNRAQRWLVENTRLGIPAIAHEECLTGLAAWKAASFPTPLAWGATFDPDLVHEMAASIGASMRALGIHQGLAPVLDVIRDPRWGRVEECISEDPYLVGTIGTEYVRGLQSAGIIATLKHFVGYSASRAGRNLAPVHAGRRELADTLLIPFEMAVLDGGARSVMHSYCEIDGLPVAADRSLLTTLLRDSWGFDGTVVADYFGVAFLRDLHGVAGDLGTAAMQALTAGVDVELPTGNAYREPLAELVRAGIVSETLVDRSVRRVLRQKAELGLLGARFEAPPCVPDLDSTKHRELARKVAEESVVLIANDGTLPLTAPGSVAVIGPNAHRAPALFGCYAFVNHVLPMHPGTETGIEVPTILDSLHAEWPDAQVVFAQGCAVDDSDASGIAAAVAAAEQSTVAVVVVGDQAGLFGRGTSGEGCDRDSLELPGLQRRLVEAVLDTGTLTVLVLVTGRPYAIDWALKRCAAVVQSFFPGEEGGAALAGVMSGRVNPSGRLPVTMPRSAGAQPYSYLHPALGAASAVGNLDTSPVRAFGHGLSYTTFTHSDLRVEANEVTTCGTVRATVRVQNAGGRVGTDVVQLYGRVLVGSTTRPVAQLIGYARVDLKPGQSRLVTFDVPATRFAYSNVEFQRVVEPGSIDLWVGPDCATRETATRIDFIGSAASVTNQSDRFTNVRVV